MDDNRVHHILRRGVDSEREMIFRAPMDTEGRRGLLVFVSGEEAAELARGAGMEFLEPTPVAPEDKERVCNAHGFALARVWNLDGEGDLSVFTSEGLRAAFGAPE